MFQNPPEIAAQVHTPKFRQVCEITVLSLGDEDHMLATSAVHPYDPYDQRDQLQYDAYLMIFKQLKHPCCTSTGRLARRKVPCRDLLSEVGVNLCVMCPL